MIQNKEKLAKNGMRKTVLGIAEAGWSAIDTERLIKNKVMLADETLRIAGREFPLQKVNRIWVVGVGKCAIAAASSLEEILGDKLTGGIVVDIRPSKELKKIEAYLGTHPAPTQQNVDYTQKIVRMLKGLQADDLLICIVSGGGSTILCSPEDMTCVEEASILSALSRGGADIEKINTVRKHISNARGGWLAAHAYPAQVVGLIFSDVPGNKLDSVASAPTMKDPTTVADAADILAEYDILKSGGLDKASIIETPKEDKFFDKVTNILIASNNDALEAMKKEAEKLGLAANIVTDSLTGQAEEMGKKLESDLHVAENGIYLYGGETTVKIKGPAGKGGRNQELVLSALQDLKKGELVLSFNSDGWDNTEVAGALGDGLTLQKAEELGLDIVQFLSEHNSFDFFQKTGDFLDTGRLGCNISDLVITLKQN